MQIEISSRGGLTGTTNFKERSCRWGIEYEYQIVTFFAFFIDNFEDIVGEKLKELQKVVEARYPELFEPVVTKVVKATGVATATA